MTSRFVSGGTIAGDDGVTEDRGGAGSAAGTGKEAPSATAVEWEAVQKDLDEERRRRAEARKRDAEAGAGGERSLYEILQANKAAKQAAFEEQNRIRNQFRALDDDEVDFLHGVYDEAQAEEQRVRRETEEGLANFRKAQKGGDIAGAGNADGDGVVEEWGAASGRKRKREKEKAALKGVKRRTSMLEEDKKDERKDGVVSASENAVSDRVSSSSSGTRAKLTPTKPGLVAAKEAPVAAPTQAAAATSTSKPKPVLGLVDYGSDEDDDDD
ncbi:hypothetical protein ANO14919_060660 [Xylariales sp. No.14919]|nr:hypothetical protein ANO14919_060660 [Xylariales sp. No.14919]